MVVVGVTSLKPPKEGNSYCKLEDVTFGGQRYGQALGERI